jgi:enamine deaminase RidA (YjgF/YER057c/UK114 family)
LPRSARPRRRSAPGERQRYSSGSRWEPVVGYSRAVRVGSRIYVSGTTAFGPDGTIVGVGDPYRQTVQALDNIERALRALGSDRAAIVRLRMFVTDLGRSSEVTRALAERFPPIRPAMTLVGVSGLIEPAMLVEIEADAEDLPARPGPRGRSRAPPG